MLYEEVSLCCDVAIVTRRHWDMCDGMLSMCVAMMRCCYGRILALQHGVWQYVAMF